MNGEAAPGELAFEHEQRVLADARRLAAETSTGRAFATGSRGAGIRDVCARAAPEAVID